jgi:hypothetical protein
MDARFKQRLVSVNVSYSSDKTLVQQQRLDAKLPTSESFQESRVSIASVEWFQSELPELAGFMESLCSIQAPFAELTDVPVVHGVPVHEVEAYMGMLVDGVLTGLLQTGDGDEEPLVVSLGLVPIGKLTRHAEMNQQVIVIQSEDKKLPPSLDIPNHLAGKSLGHRTRRRTENDALATDVHVLDALVANVSQQTKANRLDFRKLWHKSLF